MISGLHIGARAEGNRHVPGRWRVLALVLIAVLLAGIVWSRLIFWQVVQDTSLAAAAQQQ